MQSSKFLAWGIMIGGIIAIISGGSNPNASWSIWLTSIGGAAVGATIGSFFIRLSADDLTNNVKLMLTKTISAKFTSKHSEIEPFKKKWYHYNVSQKNQILKWRCSIIDFSLDSTIGSLNSVAKFTDKKGKIHEYKISASMRSERLVLFYYPPFGNESIAIEIIPFMGNSFENIHPGYILLQTWDGNHSITPTLISDEPISGIETEGDIDKIYNQELNDIWSENIKRIDHILELPDIV